MNLFAVNPLSDPRWDELVRTHPASSAFHTRGWIEALRRTYGYEPVVFTTSQPETALANGILFCHVRSWLTGDRLVSVPFADHCDPLVDNAEQEAALLDGVERGLPRGYKYIELRPRQPLRHDRSTPAARFQLHTLDLTPGIDALWKRTHLNTIQRKIRRATREGVTEEVGRSPSLLEAFFRLMLLTRRRHGLAPAPYRWFANLSESMGDDLLIRVAFLRHVPIGAVLTLRHKGTLIYKYGCSDARHHAVGTMPFLMWRMIEDAAQAGMGSIDFGRSDLDQAGLIQFKERLGARPTTISYARLGAAAAASAQRPRTIPFITHLPDPLVVAAGRFLYRHLG